MRVEQIAGRGRLLTFDDDISLYLISGSRFHLLCDTHLGSASMDQVMQLLVADPGFRQLVLFNSHADWDHIWGNGAFDNPVIIGHEQCRVRMQERGIFDLNLNAHLQRGKVVLTPPNLTFSERLTFDDEAIAIRHAPGHTEDSSVCYDLQDQVLYLGDLVEDPIPYLDAADLDQYITTLTSLLDHPARILVSAHSGLVNRDLIRQNITYIKGMMSGTPFIPADFGSYEPVHRWNQNMQIVHQYSRIARERFGDMFSYVDLLMQAGDLHEQDPEHLISVLTRYLSLLIPVNEGLQ
ncbi:MAG: MBL fold metallo-hydrolase [Methanospirillum sp.]|uniref:MBL fold metallo-hydrolase n=1 Tax=Methanospirillum sp. TaxID=45200 RepID=UPI00236A092A|nr:MBL fold metallo-hydrolase [Methanospirillum sp.]MDD1728455.1 MBL fold metallo-hydrolase [Methanospirillum sp.]